jgi:hypothetical protein
MTENRWTEDFLNRLRKESDPRADEALQHILQDQEAKAISTLFSRMNSNDDAPIESTFPVLAKFFEETGNLPVDVDIDRIRRGEDVFRRHIFAGALVLLARSLPEGYQAPNLSVILNISGELRTHTYKRLLATLQTVVNVSTTCGFQRGGKAVITAQKLRLLHAGVRHLTRHYRPKYESTYGVPVCQEDMLGTIIGFSLIVIEGWRTLGAGLTRNEEEDYLYLWLTFARMMGVHPAGEHASLAYIPKDLDDAALFYKAYQRRHYVQPAQNPDGVALAQANLAMLHGQIPKLLRFLGFGILPRLLMQELMGAEACSRLRIMRLPGQAILKWILSRIHALVSPEARALGPIEERFGLIFFQDMIDRAYDGTVTFTIPLNMRQLKTMTFENGTPPS